MSMITGAAGRSPFHDYLAELAQGHEDLILELPQSWVVLGQEQFHRGYSKLIFKHYVTELHHIPPGARAGFFNEITLVGEAVQNATGAEKINIELLGNQVDHLHVHVFPRFRDEDPALRKLPVWNYAAGARNVSLTKFEKMQLTAAVRGEIIAVMDKYGLRPPERGGQ